MYQVGDLIVYGSNGVCKVTGLGTPPGQAGTGRTYYTLQPLYSSETIYAPVDSKLPMRPVLTRSEAEELILQFPSIPAAVVEEKNVQLLSHYYQSAFQANDCRDLIRLLKTIYFKDCAARKQGKHPGKLEDRYRKRGEELLYGELSVALEIPRDSVPEYIKRLLEERAS